MSGRRLRGLPATLAPAGMPLESRGCKLARHAPTVDLEASIFDPEASMFDLEASIFNLEASTFDLEASTFDLEASIFDLEPSTFDVDTPKPRLLPYFSNFCPGWLFGSRSRRRASRRLAPASIETGFPVAQNLALRPPQNARPVTDGHPGIGALLQFRAIDLQDWRLYGE